MPASPLLPVAVGPLLSGLAGASRPGGHQALAERLSGLITNKLCSCKAEAAGAALGLGLGLGRSAWQPGTKGACLLRVYMPTSAGHSFS